MSSPTIQHGRLLSPRHAPFDANPDHPCQCGSTFNSAYELSIHINKPIQADEPPDFDVELPGEREVKRDIEEMLGPQEVETKVPFNSHSDQDTQLPPIPDDPWMNRSTGMRCDTCISFVLKQRLTAMPDDRGLIGRCRKHSPTMQGFPVVFEKDWCGDHKLDEDKASGMGF
jgi:hypothetical protein